MNNPYANRWSSFADGADRFEDEAIRREANEANSMPVIKCRNCENEAFYRPGVGAYQCPNCNKLRVTRIVNGQWVERWV